ncbi:hypothetical protein A2U01_0065128, partial [Trifolium medium]|nr:hypothetical protein [Trifolium medium]
LKSLNEQDPKSNAGKNVETSGTHEDVVEDCLPATPVDNPVSNELKEITDVVTEGNTCLDESVNPNSSDEKENDPVDKTIDDNTEVVDVENVVPESPVKKTPSDSIAKRLRT